MSLELETIGKLRSFTQRTNFSKGLLALDLDGTALLEDRGKIFISSSVEKGVKAVHDLGRPVALNTLRFPLSVMNTVGEAWYQIADVPILTVLLNGSVLGYIKRVEGALIYEELAAFPLTNEEVEGITKGMEELISNGVDELVFFYYTRNWAAGETIWTPRADRVDRLKKKYTSATTVFAGDINDLREKLRAEEVCMASLFVDRPEDKLMAYQHSKRSSFFTRDGIDKAAGLRELARRLEISLEDSLGAGDTEMDTFLNEVGLAVVVGEAKLSYRGKLDTIRVADPMALGDLLLAFVALAEEKR